MKKRGLLFLAKSGLTSLKGQTILLTGASSGIGKQALAAILSLGANCIAAIRSQSKGEKLLKEYPKETAEGRFRYELYDQGVLDSILALSNRLSDVKLDSIILNAGLYHPKKGSLSKEGKSITFAVNALGTYRLVMALKKKHPHSRYVFVSSMTLTRPENDDYSLYLSDKDKPLFKEYKVSKYAINDLYFHFYYEGMNVALTHPGVSPTGIYRDLPKWVVRAGTAILTISTNPAWKASLGEVKLAASDLSAGSYLVPRGLFGIYGYPKNTKRVPNYSKERSDRLVSLLNGFTSL